MNIKINRKLETAQINLNDSNPEAALEILEDLDTTNLTETEYADYLLIKAEALILKNEYKHNLPSKAVELLRLTDDHNRYAMAKYLEGWQKQLHGQLQESRESLLEAYSSFQRCHNYSGSARTLNRLAYVYFSTGEVKLTIFTIKKAISYYEKVKQQTNTLRGRNNLAMTLFTMGRFREASEEYNKVENYLHLLKPKSVVCQQLGQAIVFAHQRKFDNAFTVMDEIKSNIKNFPREHVIYYQYLAWFYILENDFETAEKYLKKGFRMATSLGRKVPVVARMKQLMGEVDINYKRYQEASENLNDALDAALEINDKSIAGSCYLNLAKLDTINKNENDARDNFEKAIETFKSIEANYDLAVTRYYAAKSKIYNHSDNIGLLYLAKEYFKSEDITDFIKLIDLELNYFTSKAGSSKRTPITLTSCPQIISSNKKVVEQLDFARKIAPSQHNVLLSGETGTGKDLMARYIHYHSNFNGKFISINMAAIPTEMVEAELFGHAKGAYTGASSMKAGLFEEADNGTLYLNEIADTSPQLQAKLLEVLETHEVRRLGENKTHKVSFRLIAASNYNMKELIASNKFRPDLYYRLNEIPIRLIPLKERVDDIAILTKHFMKENGYIFNGENKYEEKLFDILSKKVWEGNIRELKAEVSNLCVVAELDIKRMLHLARERIEITEEGTLLKLLDKHGWNRREVARQMGISEATVRRKIKKYNFSEHQL